MKKKLWRSVALSVLAIIATTGAVAAANGEIRIPFVGGNVQMQVQLPFQVAGTTGTFLAFKEGQITSVYPGQEIANGELTIANVSPVPLAIGFDPVPQDIAAQDWPAFDTVFVVNGIKYRSGEYVLPAGAKITAGVTISIAYWAQPSAPFRGLDLRIYPLEPRIQSEKG